MVTAAERQLAAASFLYDEAALLDAHRHREWLELLSPLLVYEAPVRVVLSRREPTDQGGFGHFFRETKESLAVRVDRLYSGHANADEPLWLTRRMVSNVQVRDDRGLELDVRSNVLLFRCNAATPTFLCAERLDTLQSEGRAWLLLRRTLLLSHAVLPGPDLPVFM